MKNGEFKQLLERFDRLESKVDKVLENRLPELETRMAVIDERIGKHAKIITGVGGIVTIALSSAIAYFKRI